MKRLLLATAAIALLAGCNDDDGYKRECGNAVLRERVMDIHDEGKAQVTNLRMLDIWDDQPTETKKPGRNYVVACKAKAKFSSGPDWAIEYGVYEEREKAYTYYRKLERVRP